MNKMKTIKHQSGFAIIEVLLVLVLVGIIGFVAWRVIEANGTVDETKNKTNATAQVETTGVPVVRKSSDLTKLVKQLDDTKVDDTSATSLKNQSAF